MTFEQIAEKWIDIAFEAHDSLQQAHCINEVASDSNEVVGLVYSVTKNYGANPTLKDFCIMACMSASNEYEMTRGHPDKNVMI